MMAKLAYWIVNQLKRIFSARNLQILLSKLPKVLCTALFIGAVVFFILDWDEIVALFGASVAWIEANPFLAIIFIILFYGVTISLGMPVSQTHMLVGFSYSTVFESQLKGFWLGLPVCWTGCLLGALGAFLLSRYMFKDFVEK